jgi:hypothetical protein
MRTCTLILLILGLAITANAANLGRHDNPLSKMVEMSSPLAGYVPGKVLPGETGKTEAPYALHGKMHFGGLVFEPGWYEGDIKAGDPIFYRSEWFDGCELRIVTRHGGCGNAVIEMKYWVAKPKPPEPPCEKPTPQSTPQPTVCRPIIKIYCPPYPAPRCQPLVVNTTTNVTTNVNVTCIQKVAKVVPRMPSPYSQWVTTHLPGVVLGGGVVGQPHEGEQLCPPYPTPPINPPGAW